MVTYVSKSMSYKVSENGNETGFHIFEAAASEGLAGTPIIPVAEANAEAATVDPVCAKLEGVFVSSLESRSRGKPHIIEARLH